MRRSAAASLAVVLLAACGGSGSGPLATVGPDARSETFEAPDTWHVTAHVDAYCAVTVFSEPDGEPVIADWDENDFVLDVDRSGTFSLETSGCLEVEAVGG